MKSETSFRVFFLKQHRKNSLKNIFFPSENVFLDFSFWPQGHRTWQNAHCAVVTGDLLISPNSNQSFFCNLWKKPIISFCRHVYEGKSICCVLMEVVRDRNSKLEEDGEPPTKSSIHHRCHHHHHHHYQLSSSSSSSWRAANMTDSHHVRFLSVMIMVGICQVTKSFH